MDKYLTPHKMLNFIREYTGWSEAAIAEKLGISSSQVDRLLKNENIQARWGTVIAIQSLYAAKKREAEKARSSGKTKKRK